MIEKKIGEGGAETARFHRWIFTTQYTAPKQGNFDAQASAVFSAALHGICQAGGSADTIVKCDVVLRSTDQIPGAIKAWHSVLATDLPACRFQVVASLPQGMEIGAELIAVHTDSGLRVERFAPDPLGIPASVRVGEFIFTSLCYPDRSGSFAQEAGQVLEKTVAALEAAGGKTRDAVKNFALLTGSDKFNTFNELYAPVFCSEQDPPARTLIGISAINGGGQAALESIAYTGPHRQGFFVGPVRSELPFCSAMRAGELVFVSGQVGVFNPDGGYYLELEAQIRQMYQNIHSIAQAAGCRKESYLKCNSFFIRPEFASDVRRLADGFLGSQLCPRSSFPVEFLANPAILIESDIVAAAEV